MLTDLPEAPAVPKGKTARQRGRSAKPELYDGWTRAGEASPALIVLGPKTISRYSQGGGWGTYAP
jgi:hypothetical protein